MAPVILKPLVPANPAQSYFHLGPDASHPVEGHLAKPEEPERELVLVAEDDWTHDLSPDLSVLGEKHQTPPHFEVSTHKTELTSDEPLTLSIWGNRAERIRESDFKSTICQACLQSFQITNQKTTVECPNCETPIRTELGTTENSYLLNDTIMTMVHFPDFRSDLKSPLARAEAFSALLDQIIRYAGARGFFIKGMNGQKLILVKTIDDNPESTITQVGSVLNYLEQLAKSRSATHRGSLILAQLGVRDQKWDVLGSELNFTARMLEAQAHIDAQHVISKPAGNSLDNNSIFPEFSFEDGLRDFADKGPTRLLAWSPMPTARAEIMTSSTSDADQGGVTGTTRYGIVVAADLSGFTKWAARLSPGEIIKGINDFLWILEFHITMAGGQILERNGDEVIAFFPHELESIAIQTCQELLQKLKKPAPDQPVYDVKFGLASGELFVSDALGLNFGPAMTQAQNLQKFAGKSGLVIDGNIAQRHRHWLIGPEVSEDKAIRITKVLQMAYLSAPAELIAPERIADSQTLTSWINTESANLPPQKIVYHGPYGVGKVKALRQVLANISSTHHLLLGEATPRRADPMRDAVRRELLAIVEKNSKKSLSQITSQWELPEYFDSYADDKNLLHELLLVLMGEPITSPSPSLTNLLSDSKRFTSAINWAMFTVLKAAADRKPLVVVLFESPGQTPLDMVFFAEMEQVTTKYPLHFIIVSDREDTFFSDLSHFQILRAGTISENSTRIILNNFFAANAVQTEITEAMTKNYHHLSGGRPDILEALLRQDLQNQDFRKSVQTHQGYRNDAADLLLRPIKKLPPRSQMLFNVMALIFQFDVTFRLADLPTLSESDLETADHIAPFIRMGMIAPLGAGEFRYQMPEVWQTAYDNLCPADTETKKSNHLKMLGWYASTPLLSDQRGFELMAFHQIRAAHFQDAMQSLKSALSLASDPIDRFRLLKQMASLSYQQGFSDRFAQVCEEMSRLAPALAATLIQELANTPLSDLLTPYERARIHLSMGMVSSIAGFFDHSKNQYDLAYSLIEQTPDHRDSLLAEYHRLQMNRLTRIGAYEEAAQERIKAQQLYLKLGNTNKSIELELMHALELKNRNQLAAASRMFLKLEKATRRVNPDNLASMMYRIYIFINGANLWLKKNQHAMALEWIGKARQHFDQLHTQNPVINQTIIVFHALILSKTAPERVTEMANALRSDPLFTPSGVLDAILGFAEARALASLNNIELARQKLISVLHIRRLLGHVEDVDTEIMQLAKALEITF